jgi:hypothetical protein
MGRRGSLGSGGLGEVMDRLSLEGHSAAEIKHK